MRSSWAQPSLSRDFLLLSAAVLFVLLLVSGWVTYVTYNRHAERISTELKNEGARIERTLSTEMESANYMLAALGRQIVLDNSRDYVKLAQMLKSFDSKGYIYSIFSWVSPEQRVVVSSNKGVLEQPVDISDRDYVQKAAVDPWKMHIGKPIEGRVSSRWVIPVAMGITDYTGKFIGTIMISIDIGALTNEISNLVKREGISFAIVSRALVPLTQVSDDKNFINDNFPMQQLASVDLLEEPSGLITRGSLFWGTGVYAYYRASDQYPYIIMLGYDTTVSDETVRSLLWSRLLQLAVMAVFFVTFLWIVRVRVIKPVLDMTGIVSDIAAGRGFTQLPKRGSVEIEGLAAQLQLVGEYVSETKRIEDELRNKMFMLKKAKEEAELNVRSKSEFLAYITQEMRVPLNNIIGFAQVLKDQLYGPIENRKYRQYAADIFQTGNQLIDKIQDVLLHSKAESGYIALQERVVDVPSIVNAALRQLTDKMQVEKTPVKAMIQEGLPRLYVDDFRLQQVVMNLLLYTLERAEPEKAIAMEVKMITENRDRQFFVLQVALSDAALHGTDALLKMAGRLFAADAAYNTPQNRDLDVDLHTELSRVLIEMHGGVLEVGELSAEGGAVVLMLPSLRMRFQDMGDV